MGCFSSPLYQKITMKTSFLIVACALVACWSIHAQVPGTFDNTFGTNGLVLTNISVAPASPMGNTDDEARAVAIQTDGKIVVAGVTDDWSGSNYDFAVCRYLSNGALDTTFSLDGKQVNVISNSIEFVSDVEIQSDGKIVVLGTSNSQFVLVRFQSNGTLDNSFGVGGIVQTQVSPGAEQSSSLRIQPDGKLIAGGYCDFNGTFGFVMVRYTSSGVLDNTFGVAGIVYTPIGTASSFINDLVIQPDGKILAAGAMANIGNSSRFALARYDNTGNLDVSFGATGIVTVAPTASNNIAQSICLQNDGKIVLAGRSAGPVHFDFSVVRVNSNGTIDNSFGTNGIIVHSIGVADGINSVLLQTDGKILAAGYAMINNIRNFTLARYTTAGALDPLFGVGGVVTNSLGGSMAGIQAAAMQSDGKLVGVGTLVNGNNSIDFAVVRYYVQCAIPQSPGIIIGSSTVCPGMRTYSIAPVVGANSYSWTVPSGWTGSSVSTSISVNVTTTGTLQVAAVNSCSASASTSLSVKVNNCTGLLETNEFSESVQLYPNPTSGKVFLRSELTEETSYELYDVFGNYLKSGSFIGSQEIDLSVFAEGSYVVVMRSRSHREVAIKQLVMYR